MRKNNGCQRLWRHGRVQILPLAKRQRATAIPQPPARNEEAMPHPRRLIWFCHTEQLADHPEQLSRLKDEIGLTTVMPESPICHTSGFRASPQLAARGPFEDWRDRSDVWPKAAEGIFPPVAGVIGGFDDSPLLKVLDAAKAAGIEVWGHIGLWSYGGDVYPEHALQTMDGDPIDAAYKQWGVGLCPSRESINSWTADGLVDIARRYDVDGFCVDHARYPQPASPSALGCCGCASCVKDGQGMGYDVASLHEALRDSVRRLRVVDTGLLRRLEQTQLTSAELLDQLGVSAELTEWFRMRSSLLQNQMQRFRERVREVDPSMIFGSDVFAPSISLYGGHDLAGWEASTDYITGGSSAGGVVGWATAATNAAYEWSRALAAVSEPTEEDWLPVTLKVLGIDDLDVPRDTVSLEQARDLPIEALYERELELLAKQTTGQVPLYPPVSAGGDPVRTRRLCEAIVAHGGHGSMMTLAPGRPETLEAIRDGFAALT